MSLLFFNTCLKLANKSVASFLLSPVDGRGRAEESWSRSKDVTEDFSNFQKTSKMEEACMYSKHGYCKFKERQHYSEVCPQLEACKSTKTCRKRHPKDCKRYKTANSCQFGSECAYYHRTNQEASKPCECQSKIDILENIVTEMANKIINQENKIENIKNLHTEDTELNQKVKLLEAVVQKIFKCNKS